MSRHIEDLSHRARNYPQGRARVGTISYKRIAKYDYDNFKAHRFGDNNSAGSNQRYKARTVGQKKFTVTHAKLKRLRNHRRENLGGIETYNNNSLFGGLTYAGTGPRAKSHLVADSHGGENVSNNLINNSRSQNLQMHSVVEKSINRQIDAQESSGNRQRRGSLMVEEQMNNTGEPEGRQYAVHFDQKGSKPEYYALFKLKYD